METRSTESGLRELKQRCDELLRVCSQDERLAQVVSLKLSQILRWANRPHLQSPRVYPVLPPSPIASPRTPFSRSQSDVISHSPASSSHSSSSFSSSNTRSPAGIVNSPSMTLSPLIMPGPATSFSPVRKAPLSPGVSMCTPEAGFNPVSFAEATEGFRLDQTCRNVNASNMVTRPRPPQQPSPIVPLPPSPRLRAAEPSLERNISPFILAIPITPCLHHF